MIVLGVPQWRSSSAPVAGDPLAGDPLPGAPVAPTPASR